MIQLSIQEQGAIAIPPHAVQSLLYDSFVDYGEWPCVGQFHEHLADYFGCPQEVARHDCLIALQTKAIFGLPSIVAMRYGLALGDWHDPLPAWHNGYRLAVESEHFDRLEAIRRFWGRALAGEFGNRYAFITGDVA